MVDVDFFMNEKWWWCEALSSVLEPLEELRQTNSLPLVVLCRMADLEWGILEKGRYPLVVGDSGTSHSEAMSLLEFCESDDEEAATIFDGSETRVMEMDMVIVTTVLWHQIFFITDCKIFCNKGNKLSVVITRCD